MKNRSTPGPNPWLETGEPEQPEAAVAVVEEPEHDAVLGAEAVAEGPCVPLHAQPDQAKAALGPPASAGLLLMPLHGGSGITTLAGLLGDDAAEAGSCWRAGELLPAGWVVAVARIHGRGLEQVSALGRAWSHAQLGEQGRLLGVLLIDDGPKPSKPQVRRARSLTGAVPKTWRLPWVEAWRESPADQEPPAAPRRVRATTKNILRAHRAAVTQGKDISS